VNCCCEPVVHLLDAFSPNTEQRLVGGNELVAPMDRTVLTDATEDP